MDKNHCSTNNFEFQNGLYNVNHSKHEYSDKKNKSLSSNKGVYNNLNYSSTDKRKSNSPMNDLTFKSALQEFKNINNEIKGITRERPNEESLLEKKQKKLTLKESSKIGNTSKNHLRQIEKSRNIRESASNTSNSYGEKRVNNLSPNNLSRGKIDSKKNRESLTLFIGSGDYGIDHYLKNTENNTQNIDTKDRKPKLYEKNKGKKKSAGVLKNVPSSSKMTHNHKGHSILYDANNDYTWFHSPKNNSISINLQNTKPSNSFLKPSKNKQLNGIKRKIMGKAIGKLLYLIKIQKTKKTIVYN